MADWNVTMMTAHDTMMKAYLTLINDHALIMKAHLTIMKAHSTIMNAHSTIMNAHATIMNAQATIRNWDTIMIVCGLAEGEAPTLIQRSGDEMQEVLLWNCWLALHPKKERHLIAQIPLLNQLL